MRRHSLLLLSLVLGAGALGALPACGPEVETQDVTIALQRHDCEERGLTRTFGVYVVLAERGGQLHSKCIDTLGIFETLAQLQAKLRASVRIDRLARGGIWDLWVLGGDKGCSEGMQISLCGTDALLMPPAGNQVQVKVDCEDPASDEVNLQRIKAQIKACRVNIPPWFVPR